MSFSVYDVERRTAKNTFFKQINTVIDWQSVQNIINDGYTVGKSATGTPGHDGLLLFKMLLIGIWYDLSDREVEEMVNENLSAMKFCGLQLESVVPDHSSLCRFRKQLTDKKVFELIFIEINRQLLNHGIMVKSGCKIDATITNSERSPKKKPVYEIAVDRKEEEVAEEEIKKQTTEIQLIKQVEKGVDTEARYLKKGNKLYFGYKMHVGTDENGLILSLVTTSANVHDSQTIEEIIEKANLPKRCLVYGDKAYRSKSIEDLLKSKSLKNRTHFKAKKGNPLNERQKLFNNAVSKSRYTVERTFAGIHKWFGGHVARYVGIAKTETQHYLQSMCYNLKRAPRLIMELEIKTSETKLLKA